MAGTDDLMCGLDELAEARPVYDEAWSYWKSTVPEVFFSQAWRRMFAKSDGKFRLNVARVPIVSLSDRLRVLGAVATGPDGQKDPAADQVLQDQVWKPCKLGLQTKRLIRNTLICGDSYWWIWPIPGETPDTPARGVTIRYNDPRIMRAIYDDDDDLDLRYLIKSWQEHGRTRATLIYPDRLELGWVLDEDGKVDDPQRWKREQLFDDNGDPVAIDVPVPAAFAGRPPVHHFRTDLPYGSPEAESMWGPQDAVQKLASTLAHTSERAGLRDRFLLTDPAAALNGDGADNPDWDDDVDAGEGNRDDSRARSGPGDTQVLTGIKAVGEWSAADPSGFMEPAEWFLRFGALISRVSSRYADPGGQHPSGAALRAADAPEAAKTEDRQEYLDGELAAALCASLRVLGVEDPRVAIRWKPGGIVDDVDTWQIAEAKIRAGVPVQVALVETGLYEPDTVRQWLADTSTEMDVARRVGLLTELGSAVQQLGQGVALGLLDEGTAKSIVQTTLGQLTLESGEAT